jgi:hypothetical protein
MLDNYEDSVRQSLHAAVIRFERSKWLESHPEARNRYRGKRSETGKPTRLRVGLWGGIQDRWEALSEYRSSLVTGD